MMMLAMWVSLGLALERAAHKESYGFDLQVHGFEDL